MSIVCFVGAIFTLSRQVPANTIVIPAKLETPMKDSLVTSTGPAYKHRTNWDGSFDSICLNCFLTVATTGGRSCNYSNKLLPIIYLSKRLWCFSCKYETAQGTDTKGRQRNHGFLIGILAR